MSAEAMTYVSLEIEIHKWTQALRQAKQEELQAKLEENQVGITKSKIAIIEAQGTLAQLKEVLKSKKQFTPSSDYDERIKDEVAPMLDQLYLLRRDKTDTESLYAIGEGKEVSLLATNKGLLHRVFGWAQGTQHSEGFTERKAEQAYFLWRGMTKPLVEEPALVKFKSQDPDEYTFRRLPFDPAEGPIPAWKEFEDRLADAQVWRAFVWSIFEAKNEGRQTMWLTGEGEDGKSRVLKVLSDAMGSNGCAALTGAALKEPRFLAATCYGKRLVVYADCKNPRFLMSEFLRNLSSGDAVAIERKGKDAFTGTLMAKVIVASNPMPEITSQKADLSRLILMPVAPSPVKDDATWPQRLVEELPAYLYACREAYGVLCPGHGKITLSAAMLDLVKERAEEFEDEFQVFFDRYYVKEEGASTSAGTVQDDAKDTWNAKADQKLSDFKEWIVRTNKGRYGKSGSVRRYNGFRPKHETQPLSQQSEHAF